MIAKLVYFMMSIPAGSIVAFGTWNLLIASGRETPLMFGKISAIQWVPGNHSPSIQ